MSIRARIWTPILVGVAVFAAAPAARAQTLDTHDPVVVLTGRIEVRADETTGEVIIFHGPIAIDGTVDGDAVAFSGDVLVSGRVTGDVTALDGRVTVEQGASVEGDVVSSDPPSIAEGTVAGSVTQQGFRFRGPSLFLVSRLAVWLAATVGSFLIGLFLTLLLPRAADAISDSALRRPWPTIGWGVLFALGVPILGVILIATLVGGLLGVAVLLALLLIYSIAYAAGAYAMGRAFLRAPRPRFLAFLLGWGVLRILALIPVIGGLALSAAAVWGLGAIVVAGFLAGRGGSPEGPSSATAPIPPPPPMPAV